jgi:hypothetical protein
VPTLFVLPLVVGDVAQSTTLLWLVAEEEVADILLLPELPWPQ